MKWIVAAAALVVLILAVWGLQSKSSSTVFGRGKIVTEPRQLERFDALNISDKFDVYIKVDASIKSPKAVITTNQNLMEYIETSIEGNVLSVRAKEDKNLKTKKPVNIHLVVPKLQQIAVYDNSAVFMDGKLPDLRASIAGSGQLAAQGLKLGSANVNLSESGKARVFVTGTLIHKGAGTSELHYQGQPRRMEIDLQNDAKLYQDDGVSCN